MTKQAGGISKGGLFIIALLLAGHARADEGGFDGYSYFVLGSEGLNYREKPDSVPVHTNTRVSNIALRTGGLFAINRSLDFSLDTGATLLPGTATETWQVNGGSAGDAFRAGLPSPGSPVQRNDFRLSLSSLQALVQYKHSDRIRTVYGINYSLASFKRFNWSTVQGSAVTLSQGAVEEDTSDLDAAVGMDFESAALARQNRRWQVRAVLRVPVWRQTTNTNNPDITFTDTSGAAVEIQGSYNYRFYKGMEAGLHASYGLREDGKDSKGDVELPKHTLSSFFVGLQLSWNLSRKT
jgi:hypothetical protein